MDKDFLFWERSMPRRGLYAKRQKPQDVGGIDYDVLMTAR
jgi:hypothetical protein